MVSIGNFGCRTFGQLGLTITRADSLQKGTFQVLFCFPSDTIPLQGCTKWNLYKEYNWGTTVQTTAMFDKPLSVGLLMVKITSGPGSVSLVHPPIFEGVPDGAGTEKSADS